MRIFYYGILYYFFPIPRNYSRKIESINLNARSKALGQKSKKKEKDKERLNTFFSTVISNV